MSKPKLIHRAVPILSILLLTQACATTKDSVLLGIGIGTGAGTTVGYHTNRTRSATAIGALVGATLGGLLGWLIHENEKERPRKAQTQTQALGPLDVEPGEQPDISAPHVEVISVPDQVKGDRYIQSHKVWILKHKSKWRKN